MPTITYNPPADKQTDFFDAMRRKFRVDASTTPAQLAALIEAEFKQSLINTYREYMRDKDYPIGLD